LNLDFGIPDYEIRSANFTRIQIRSFYNPNHIQRAIFLYLFLPVIAVICCFMYLFVTISGYNKYGDSMIYKDLFLIS